MDLISKRMSKMLYLAEERGGEVEAISLSNRCTVLCSFQHRWGRHLKWTKVIGMKSVKTNIGMEIYDISFTVRKNPAE